MAGGILILTIFFLFFETMKFYIDFVKVTQHVWVVAKSRD